MMRSYNKYECIIFTSGDHIMEKLKRNDRVSVISHVLTSSPNQIFTLNHFCQMFDAAKSTISEDIDLVRKCFAKFGLGMIETVAGAAGGVRYLPFPVNGSLNFINGVCHKLSTKDRVLPGGYLYTNDIMSDPKLVNTMGRLIASQFYRQSPDFVLTVETKGISLAMAVANALGVNAVVAKRDQQQGQDWPFVSINYISGSSGKIQTMSLAKKLVKEGQRALIVDDFMKAGGTARGMIEMMSEFSITVVGVGMMMLREMDVKRRVEDVRSLMIVKNIDEDRGATVVPAPWISNL